MDGSGVRSQAWDVSRATQGRDRVVGGRRNGNGWVMLRDRCSVKRGCRRNASRPSRFVSWWLQAMRCGACCARGTGSRRSAAAVSGTVSTVLCRAVLSRELGR